MTAEIGVAAVRGVVWTGGAQVVRQLVQVVGSVALARLLAPGDFGLLGMALFFIGIGQLFADFGIGSAIVQARVDDRIVLSSCFWLNLAVGLVLGLSIAAASPLIASFYHRSDLAPVVTVLALNLVLAGVQVVPQSVLYRDMKFAELARAQVLGSVGGTVLAIVLAWLGAGVWALVAQPLFGSTVVITVCLLASRWRPHFEYSTKPIASLARFSINLLGTNLVGYANRNADALLVGRFLGAGPLGLYSMAIQLMLYPLQQVSSVIVRVLFPTMVQMGSDIPRMRSAYLKAVGAIAVVTFPMMGGLFAVAPDFVPVVLGPNWTGMVPVLQVLAWVGMLQSIGTTVGTIYLATGQLGIAFRVSLVCAAVVIGGIVAGLHWGILGVALGYGAASFLLFYYTIITAFRLIALKVENLHAVIIRPVAATVAMVVIVLLARSALDVQPVLRLALCVAIGAAAYLGLSMVLNRGQIREIIAMLRRASRSGPVEASPALDR